MEYQTWLGDSKKKSGYLDFLDTATTRFLVLLHIDDSLTL